MCQCQEMNKRSVSLILELLSLKVGKSLKIGFDFLLDFWQKKYFINGDVLNAE